MTHNPYLEITLSTKPLGLEAGWGVACQYVLATRRRTRGNRKGEDAEEVDNGATKVDDEATKGIEIVEEDAGVAQDRQGGGQMGKKRKADASQEAGRGKKRGKGATRVHSTG
jgi:hypothetical protein